MTYVRISAVAALAIVMLSATQTRAMTPGADKHQRDPETVSGLAPQEAQRLKNAKCQVVSYRNQDVPTPSVNSSGKPDEQDELMLARGEFAEKGQQDLLALCRHAETGLEFFVVVWGGPARCENTLMVNSASRYWKERGAQLDYYGSHLAALPQTHVSEFLDTAALPARGDADMGTEKKWILQQRYRPEFKHDSFVLSGNFGVAFYCNGREWIKLYDYYSTVMD